MGNLVSGDLGGQLDVADPVTMFFGFPSSNIDAYVRALREKGMLEILAEPNLIARSGEKASFLAGGEFPIPVVQSGANNSITIEYKEFGVRIEFLPTVTEREDIHMKVMSEVSDLDFSQGVQLGGFVIPTIITRRADTAVKLGDGQTFAIAGLINKEKQLTRQKIPGLGDVPLLGNLFKAKQLEEVESELLIMVTPHLVEPLDDADGYPGPSEIRYESISDEEVERLNEGLQGVLDDPAIRELNLPELEIDAPENEMPRIEGPQRPQPGMKQGGQSMESKPEEGAAIHEAEISAMELPEAFRSNGAGIAMKSESVRMRETIREPVEAETEFEEAPDLDELKARFQKRNSKGMRSRW